MPGVGCTLVIASPYIAARHLFSNIPSQGTLLTLILVLALLGSQPAPAAVDVVVHGERIDVSARSAPLSQVVEQIAEAIGAQVEYGGPPPEQLVTLALVDQTPAEVFVSVLSEQGADFALLMDAAGTSVAKLVIATDTSLSGAGPSAPTPPLVEPPAEEALRDVMSRLGVQLDELEAEAESDDSGEDGEEPETPELPGALQRLLDQAGANGERAPGPPQLPFPVPGSPPDSE